MTDRGETTAQALDPAHSADTGKALAELTPEAHQLRRQNEYLSALHETALGLINRLDPVDLLEAIVTRASQLVGTSHAHVYLVDSERNEIEVKVAIGAVSHFRGYRLKRGEGLAGRVWQTGEPLVVDDYDRWPSRAPSFPYALLHGVVGMPLKSGADVVGVMVLAYVEQGRTFGYDELDLLSRFAQLAALTLDNARLYASAQQALAERKQAEQLERDRNRVLEMVAKSAALPDILTQITLMVERQHPGVLCSILLLRDGRLYHGAAPSLPDAYTHAIDGMAIGPAAGSCGTACYRGDAVIVDDIATDPLWEAYRELGLSNGFRACWSVPILSSAGQVLGAFAMYCREPRRPRDADLKMIETARSQAAVAIEHRQLTDQLAYQAHHDALTGLPNRVLYEDRLQQALAHAHRDGRFVALFMIDLDRFKRINDTLGHHVGDLVLTQVAQRLRACVRGNDTLARWGGDEFILILTDLNTPNDAAHIAETVLDILRMPFTIDEHELFVTASIGISLYPTDSQDPGELLRHADSAMYRADEQGKNAYEFFAPDVGAAASERLRIENQLRRAVERGELEVYYQPQVVVRSGRLMGVEALLRWNHPERGVLPAAEFISIAEESGLIVPIGTWLLEEACRQARSWQRSGFYPLLRVAVNVSTMQFRRPDFLESVVRALAQADLAAGFLELELVESLMMRDVEASARQMDGLRALGVTIAIDDFGTGYSSLSYLHRFRIDSLKIAQSFIQGIEGTETTRPLVQAIVAVARNLEIRVTAEGVETPQQLRFLRRLGCDRAQGYLLGKPLPVREFEAFLGRSRF